ncbi:cilia- and flagella-associated protein 119 [Denticeps clupeoides]|uniref:cilia- and flagella-associated protein 119 n=1 Tax=Denticeps clupeoides TaxID=299321 RepID=UPI0010A593E7|nr:coiled-coil domain-containing protein 189 [Denticeps clupeoides]
MSSVDVDEVEQAPSLPELEPFVGGGLRRGILQEMYRNTSMLSRDMNLSREQTSVLTSIVKNVHQANIGSPLNNMDECFSYCSELLLAHSVWRPPFSVDLFSLDETTRILKYFTNTYMRHFMLYKYIFTPQMELDLSLTYSECHEDTPVKPDEVPAAASGTRKQDEEKDHGDSRPGSVLETTESENIRTPSAEAKLKEVVQKEVRSEMRHLLGQLEQRLQQSTDQLHSALLSLEATV